MKIDIEWIDDDIDCETCGMSSANGAVVKFDDETVIDMTPCAACYDGTSFSEYEVYSAIFEKLGESTVGANDENWYLAKLKELGHEVHEGYTDIGMYQHHYEDDE